MRRIRTIDAERRANSVPLHRSMPFISAHASANTPHHNLRNVSDILINLTVCAARLVLPSASLAEACASLFGRPNNSSSSSWSSSALKWPNGWPASWHHGTEKNIARRCSRGGGDGLDPIAVKNGNECQSGTGTSPRSPIVSLELWSRHKSAFPLSTDQIDSAWKSGTGKSPRPPLWFAFLGIDCPRSPSSCTAPRGCGRIQPQTGTSPVPTFNLNMVGVNSPVNCAPLRPAQVLSPLSVFRVLGSYRSTSGHYVNSWRHGTVPPGKPCNSAQPHSPATKQTFRQLTR